MDDHSNTPLGLTLLIDKPLEWTSFDVVNKLRYAAKRTTGKKKIKVGHAGTLDPLATGLVIVCIGSHTKQINTFMDLPKQYTGTLRLGATTPSFDLETEVDHTFDLPVHDEQILQQTAANFEGEIDQIPPIFSAKKINGQKAYDLARKGRDVELKPSKIKIDRFEIDSSNFPEIAFSLDCSKGTYVRSLAHDFGAKLNSGAHLTSLRRTKIGAYSITNALQIEEAITQIETQLNTLL